MLFYFAYSLKDIYASYVTTNNMRLETMLLIVFTFFVENFQILLFKNDYH